MDPEAIASLKKALSKPEVVSVLGIELELTAPSLDRSIEVRQLLFHSAEDAEKSPETFIKTTVAAVKACLPVDFMNDDEIASLVLRSGGENGELASTSMDLLGLGNFMLKTAKDSTPFS